MSAEAVRIFLVCFDGKTWSSSKPQEQRQQLCWSEYLFFVFKHCCAVRSQQSKCWWRWISRYGVCHCARLSNGNHSTIFITFPSIMLMSWRVFLQRKLLANRTSSKSLSFIHTGKSLVVCSTRQLQQRNCRDANPSKCSLVKIKLFLEKVLSA